MQTLQSSVLPVKEIPESVSNKSASPPVVGQVAAPDERVLREKEGVVTSLPRQRQLSFPLWPISQPGPEVTAPSPGQRLVPGRTDQVTYDSYDQERGRPGLPSPVPSGQTRESIGASLETRPIASTASQAKGQPVETLPLRDRARIGQQVYDTQGARVGRVAVRFPLYLLIERRRIFPQVYYVPLALIGRVEGLSLWLTVSEATLKADDYAQVPPAINDVPAPPANEDRIDISDVSSLGLSPLTPAQTGHYHYGPHSPGINTDAGGSYTPAEVDPRGRLRDRPARLYITGKRLSSRDG